MTNPRILRVSLAATAEDFEPLVLEPGLPLLDPSGSSEEVVRTWLGRFAAKPVMKGDQVDFILCDDDGQPVTDTVTVDPIAASDLSGDSPLRVELTELETRLEKTEPSNESEKRLEAVLRENLEFLTGKSPETHRACQLFKYELSGITHLVWCWGYQRKGPELIAPIVCTNPDCQLLFLKRNGNVCPACKKAAERAAAVAGGSSSPLKWLVAGALLLAAVGLGYWLKPGGENVAGSQSPADPFVAEPSNWQGPIGAKVPLVASLKGVENKPEGNVIGQSVVVVDDPTVLKLDDDGTSVKAKSVGKTVVHYYYGEYETQSTFIVQPASMPESLTIEPANAEIAKGSTSDYRVMGKYADGSTADLTDVSTVSVKGDAIYESDGKVQGVREGTAKLEAKYRPDPSKEPIEAEAEVTVDDAEFNELTLDVDPKTLAVGKKAAIAATLTATDGKTHSADKSSGLQMSVSPSHVAKIKAGQLIATAPGDAVLNAVYEGLSAEINFSVDGSVPAESLPFAVKPNQLKLVVGESASLEMTGGDSDASEASSSDSSIVKVDGDLNVVGVSPGEATITVQRGDESLPVAVEVIAANIQGIAIEPENIQVPVGESVPFRVVGLTKDGDQIELDSEQLSAVRVPPESQATVDMQQQTVHGLQPSDGSVGRLSVQYQDLTANAAIEVVVAPASIEMSPADSLELPVGQKQKIDVFAVRGNQRTKLEPKQVRWNLEPESSAGLRFDRSTAAVTAIAASDEPLKIRASLPGGESEASLMVSVVAAESLQISVSSEKTNYLVGETGKLQVKSDGASGAASAATPVRFASSDEKIVRVNPSSGVFKAIAEGTATVTATHPDAAEDATVDLNVMNPETAKLVIDPSEATVVVGNRVQLAAKLLRAEEQDSSDNGMLDPNDVEWSFDRPDAVRWQQPFLTGRKVAEQFQVRASYKGMEAVATIQVTPSADADGKSPTIRIQPSESRLAVDQSVTLQVERQTGEDDSWTEVSPQNVQWESSPAVVIEQTGNGRAIATLVSGEDKEPQTVSATFRDGKAEMKIEVLDEAPAIAPEAQLTIRREPAGDSVPVGQSQTYMVVADEDPESASVPNVQWMPAFENAHVVWDPPTLTAKQSGSTQSLWAEANGKRIEFETELVEGVDDMATLDELEEVESADGLDITPDPIELSVGESLAVGDGLGVDLDGKDISGSVKFKSTDTTIVRYSKNTNSIVGVAPGEAELAVLFENDQQTVSVTVTPAGMTDADTEQPSTIEISPADGELQIGQALPLRVTVKSKEGEPMDRTDSAIFGSSDSKILKVDGNQIVGVSAGEAEVNVSLPGHDPATATFSVVGGKLTDLVAEPASLAMNVGDSSSFTFSATNADGNSVELSSGELEFQVDGDNPGAIEINSDGLVRAVQVGNASITVTGNDGLSGSFDVTVTELEIQKLRIEPSKTQIVVGEKQTFQVFAISDDDETPVDTADGVMLSLSDKSVGRIVEGGLIVEAASAGKLSVKANFGGKSATATITVNADPSASLKDAPMAIERLRFDPDTMTLELDAEAEFRVIAIDSEGAEQPAFDDVKLSVDPEGTLELKQTSDGWLVRAIKPGNATVTATSGDASSVTPMLVEVVDTDPSEAKLVASPSPLRIAVGELRELDSVEVQFDSNQEPLAVLPKITSSDPSIVKVTGDGKITGVKEGDAELSISTSKEPYQSLESTIRVTVIPGDPIEAILNGEMEPTEDGDDPASDLQLVLSGPDEVTVGATVNYTVQVVGDSGEKDVTNESVQLLVEPINEADKVNVQTGGRVTGVKPGQVTIRAQYKDLISNPIPLVITQVADKFQSIELELADKPISVGETRDYQLWGVPIGGGARQDLTDQVTTDLEDKTSPRIAIKPTAKNGGDAAKVVEHQPPTIIATGPGEFQIIAAMGDVKSKPRKITVLPANDRESSLRAEPTEISVQVGQTIPPITIYSASPGSSPKQVAAKLVSDDPAILTIEADPPGVFTGLRPGKTAVTATFNNATVSVPVTVVGNRVENVSLSDVELTDDGFTLQVNLEGQHPEGELEYRAVTPNGESKTDWKSATVNDSLVTAELPIGSLRRGDKNRIYQLIIESRLKDGGAVQRFPVAFRLIIDAKQATAE